jgi:hypothetical protein
VRNARMNTIGKGLRRRGRLIGQAFSPPEKVVRTAGAADTDGGYAAPPTPRLVDSPVFVLSPVRSGSTLLRVLLNSHSRIRAPHEMHLRTLNVRLERDFTAAAMRELELDREQLEHLLWDRVLDLELRRSGKDVIVDKTPPNTLFWPRLHRCWPEARYIFLLRHPAAVVTSLVNRRAEPDIGQIHEEVLGYAESLEQARSTLTGHVVTYEQLTAEPEKVTRELCQYLDVAWEPGMLDYGDHDHGGFRPQLGDWSSNIRSGRIQPAREITSAPELPARLREIASAWGYEV